MSNKSFTDFEKWLAAYDDTAWRAALAEVLPYTHEVDRNATQIWFYFFPLALVQAFEQAEDQERLALELEMQGKFFLKDQVDSSHVFLYGHRFWPAVKREIVRLAGAGQPQARMSLACQIRDLATLAAAEGKVEQSLMVGIAAVGLMTLQQVGLEKFSETPGQVQLNSRLVKKSPEQVLAARAKDDGQGLFGFLRTTDKRYTVVWDEANDDRRFNVVNMQEVASGAATDKRPWHEVEPRCTAEEGPIPVQCRSASCGTCWIGVLGGEDKLTEVAARERRRMPEFGYIDTEEARPLIRLACQAQALGSLSIVIPPWNGYFGKYLRRAAASSAGD